MTETGKNTVGFQRELEVRYRTDVLVVGGGPAGMAAALTAARQGASVRLIEAHSCLGGMGTAGMVPGFSPFTDGVHFLAGGIGQEVFHALQAAGGVVPPGRGIRVEDLKRVYDELLQASRVAFTFHTQLVDVVAEGGRVSAAICAGKSGLFALQATVFVDCTGDGLLATLAGAPYEKGDAAGHMMPGTLCSLWAGIDWDAVRQSGFNRGNVRVEEAIRDGLFTLEDRHLPGMWRVGATLGGGNIGHTFDVDGTDEESLTRAYLWGRKSMLEFDRYYKEYLKGYEQMELAGTGSLLGVRETRRILGDYILNLDDFQRRAVFEDEIGRYCHPVDIHIARPDKASYDVFRKAFESQRLDEGESYGIPYRILTPRGLHNVLVAGRCVSTDRAMQASIRVMPGCYITGQAAGMSAAMAVESGVDTRRVDVAALQTRLKAMGGYLPNCA